MYLGQTGCKSPHSIAQSQIFKARKQSIGAIRTSEKVAKKLPLREQGGDIRSFIPIRIFPPGLVQPEQRRYEGGKRQGRSVLIQPKQSQMGEEWEEGNIGGLERYSRNKRDMRKAMEKGEGCDHTAETVVM